MYRVTLVPVIVVSICVSLECAETCGGESGAYRYPKVYGDTGSPYGQTQAHYRYLRRFGHPWHGHGGLTSSFCYGSDLSVNVRRGQFIVVMPRPYVHLPYALLGTGPCLEFFLSRSVPGSTGYVYTAPSLYYTPPVAPPWNVLPAYGPVAPGASTHRELDPPVGNDKQPPKYPRDAGADEVVDIRPVDPSTTVEKLKSVRLQAMGDVWLRQQKYASAYNRYQAAVAAAEDRAAAWFRLAHAAAAMERYQLAVEHFKRGQQIDPSWPQTGSSLNSIFGDKNALAKTSMIHNVAAWVRGDIRDPDRLFLLGVLLYFDEDIPNALELFESARQLTGDKPHLLAFLELATAANQQPSDPVAAARALKQQQPEFSLFPPPAPALPDREASQSSQRVETADPADNGRTGPQLPPPVQ